MGTGAQTGIPLTGSGAARRLGLVANRRVNRRSGLKAAAATVTRGFAFVDLCGFSDFVDAEGAERASEVLTATRSSIRVVSSAYGIRVAKWLGDGALVVGTDVKGVLAGILEIRADVVDRQVPLLLRGGATAGKALVFEGDDYIGRPINLAAKLCALAEPGRILVPQSLAETHADVVRIGARTTKQVPGTAAPVELAVIEMVEPEADQEPLGPGTVHGAWTLPAV
jgi:adenylate cyclase